MSLSWLSFIMLASAFIAQGIISALAAIGTSPTVRRGVRAALPLVEFGFLLGAFVFALGGLSQDDDVASGVAVGLSLVLLVIHVGQQSLRVALLRGYARLLRTAALPNALLGDVPDSNASDRREADTSGEAEDPPEIIEVSDDDEDAACRLETRVDRGNVPMVQAPKVVRYLFVPTHIYQFWIDVQIMPSQDTPGALDITVTVESSGIEISPADIYQLGAQLVRGAFIDGLNPLPARLIGIEPPLISVLRRLSARLNIEIETTRAIDTALATVLCVKNESGKCRVDVTRLVTPSITKGPFSAAAIINVQKSEASQRIVKVICTGQASFEGRLAIRKITATGKIEGEIDGPLKLTPSGEIEVEIEPQDTKDGIAGGRAFSFECVQSEAESAQ